MNQIVLVVQGVQKVQEVLVQEVLGVLMLEVPKVL